MAVAIAVNVFGRIELPIPSATKARAFPLFTLQVASGSAGIRRFDSMSMGKGKMWSQDRAMSTGEAPLPLLSPLQSGQKDIAPIYKFVLTGGPCAGKTTSLDRLSTFFRDRGFRVYVVPEASTLLQTGGAFFL